MTFVYFLAAATGVEALRGVLRISFPLAVVASELILGATAYERRGRGGRAVTQTRTPRQLRRG